MDAVNDPSILGTIKFVAGPMTGTIYQITKPVTNVGREPGNDIVITDPSVSRHHAQIIWNNGTWSIKKVVARNSLTVNQREVEQSPLQDQDAIVLGGGTTLLFQAGAVAAKPTTPAAPMGQAPQFGQVPQGGQMPPVGQTPQGGPPPHVKHAAHAMHAGGAGQAPPMGQPQIGQVPPPPVVNTPPVIEPDKQPRHPRQHTQHAAPPPPPATPSQGGYVAPPPYTPTMDAQHYGGPGTERAPLFGPDGGQGTVSMANTATLEVSNNTHHETNSYPLNQPVIDIGRDPSNTIVINRPTVSTFHAQIVREGNQLVFIHPHPKRGKTLNGITYKGHTYAGNEPFRHVLTRGDVFRISDENGTFVTLSYNDGSGSTQEVVPEIHPIPLGAPVITLGRMSDNTVVLNHPQVSAYHARMEQFHGSYRISDLGSTNHVYVNAHRVTNHPLKPGDDIRIGPFKLIFTGTELTQHDESSSIRIDALHLKKVGNKRVILLNDISIAIPPRKFVAVVGGSGAGKSTLLDALNGLRPAQEGAVLYNGQDYYHHLAAFSTQLGYVPQDDIIHRDLSVERALHYAARLRLPNDFTRKQIKERIDEVLDDVEMKHRRHLLVSRLSGGQRKRVSIAMELLANPSVFFLDEPTSGLDPGLDRKMMLLLRKLADKGHTIVLVTHATNNINACDYVCFLCQGGHLAYYGPPNEAKTYFGKTDFAEIYSALEPTEEAPDIPAQAEAKFRQSPEFNRYVAGPLSQGPAGRANVQMQTAAVKPPKRGNPWKQFRILSERYLELLKNDIGNLAILLLQAPLIGLVLFFLTGTGTFTPTSITTCPTRQDPTATSGPIVSNNCQRVVDLLATPQGQQFAAQQGKTPNQILQQSIEFGSGGDAQKILFIMAFAAVMFGCINGAREIVKEAPVYRRERTVNLGIAPYMFSKIVVLGILCLLQSLVLVALVNLKAPFTHSILFPNGDKTGAFLEIYVSMALTSLAGLMIGLTISAIVPNNDRAMSLVPLALIPQVIFSGVIFSLDQPQLLQIAGAFFPARWAMAAMGSTMGLHGDKLGADSFSYWGNLFSTYKQSEAVFHLFLCWFLLALTIIILSVLIAWFLKKKDVRA
ncbi:MAG TPA: FHA domain-containing protein [Ktedonobacteraceae bacterium]|nr:FHA domain-containing protein [Ktedonobacteraceae bacterium]